MHHTRQMAWVGTNISAHCQPSQRRSDTYHVSKKVPFYVLINSMKNQQTLKMFGIKHLEETVHPKITKLTNSPTNSCSTTLGSAKE